MAGDDTKKKKRVSCSVFPSLPRLDSAFVEVVVEEEEGVEPMCGGGEEVS